mmetsp:Transcript_48087/g.114451  ORF Transcript_48087/g.114451 Transcript_48087/m.114451 type:complete len:296 (-) Transcript_48087:474-1361(-)
MQHLTECRPGCHVLGAAHVNFEARQPCGLLGLRGPHHLDVSPTREALAHPSKHRVQLPRQLQLRVVPNARGDVEEEDDEEARRRRPAEPHPEHDLLWGVPERCLPHHHAEEGGREAQADREYHDGSHYPSALLWCAIEGLENEVEGDDCCGDLAALCEGGDIAVSGAEKGREHQPILHMLRLLPGIDKMHRREPCRALVHRDCGRLVDEAVFFYLLGVFLIAARIAVVVLVEGEKLEAVGTRRRNHFARLGIHDWVLRCVHLRKLIEAVFPHLKRRHLFLGGDAGRAMPDVKVRG